MASDIAAAVPGGIPGGGQQPTLYLHGNTDGCLDVLSAALTLGEAFGEIHGSHSFC